MIAEHEQIIHQLYQPPPTIINNIRTLIQEAETAINEAIFSLYVKSNLSIITRIQ